MMTYRFLHHVVVSFVAFLYFSSAFSTSKRMRFGSPSSMATHYRSENRFSTSVYGMPKEFRPSGSNEDEDNNDNDDTGSSFNIESARQQLESLMGGENESKSDNFSTLDLIDPNQEIQLPHPPPMTSIDRDRRIAEMKAIQRLEEGDEAARELWGLWFAEKGPKAQALLKQADSFINTGDPRMFTQCEEVLLMIIQEYGVYWSEPVNRLATVYYLQGRFEESYKLCQVVLKVKPWHFGALSGITMVCIGKGDRDAAIFWAERQLPSAVASTSFQPFEGKNGPSNPKRAEWVERAVNEAKEALGQAERETQQSFGEPEDYYNQEGGGGKNQILDDEESDAWQ